MKQYWRRYKGRIILGIIATVLFVPFYINVTTSREARNLQNTACPALNTQALCKQNNKCVWSSGFDFCCQTGTYPTENSFGKIICCVNGETCD